MNLARKVGRNRRAPRRPGAINAVGRARRSRLCFKPFAARLLEGWVEAKGRLESVSFTFSTPLRFSFRSRRMP